MGFIGELNRYVVGRAIRRDVKSVKICRDMVDAVNGAFMQFEFRNGPLRRRYDAIKYTLKKLETTLYELSLTTSEPDNGAEQDEQPAKRMKLESGVAGAGTDAATEAGDDAVFDKEEFAALQKEMELYDDTRDKIIRRSRDVTKAGKNAIYALHRDDLPGAEEQLKTAEEVAAEILIKVIPKPISITSLLNSLLCNLTLRWRHPQRCGLGHSARH
jgi:predicted translin family RNA/ssDNA-binding protein